MFTPHKSQTGAALPYEYLPAAEGSYKVGQLLTVPGGKLAAITAARTTSPEYLCMAQATVAAGESLPVTRINHDTIFETTLSAEDADCAIGTKLEISAGGLEVDGTAAGSFEVVYVDDTAKGGMVRGRFL